MYKHERITIVILSYVIGFSTAFIAFNFVNPGYINQSEGQPLAVAAPKANSLKIEKTETINASTLFEEKADGLYALIDGSSRILSAQAISATDAAEGFHFKVLSTSASPDGKFIHYCAQALETDEVCKHYIYDLVNDATYRVEMPTGEQLTSEVTNVYAEWLPDGILTTEKYVAASAASPWELFAKPEVSID